jgi:hypothetical protein
MAKLWLLKGGYEAPGWKDLERDAKDGTTDVTHFDRLAWALVYADEAPTRYEGLEPTEPSSGMYVDPNGVPVYIVDGKEVADGRQVIAALGEEAEKVLEQTKDPDMALDRLGRAF